MNHPLQHVHGSSGGQVSSLFQSRYALTSLAMVYVMHLIHVNVVESQRGIVFRRNFRLRLVSNDG
jgi:hypothetical protein